MLRCLSSRVCPDRSERRHHQFEDCCGNLQPDIKGSLRRNGWGRRGEGDLAVHKGHYVMPIQGPAKATNLGIQGIEQDENGVGWALARRRAGFRQLPPPGSRAWASTALRRRQSAKRRMPNNVDGFRPNNSESDSCGEGGVRAWTTTKTAGC
jgi:hypothetical protein